MSEYTREEILKLIEERGATEGLDLWGKDLSGIDLSMDAIEESMIRKALVHHAGNISRAAEALGMSRAALYRRLEKYGIES